jgi:hypothetical protein
VRHVGVVEHDDRRLARPSAVAANCPFTKFFSSPSRACWDVVVGMDPTLADKRITHK